MIPNDGIGLARMEFVINNYIKIHPMALVHPEKVTDEAVKAKIDAPYLRVREPGRLFCRETVAGHRDDRSRLLPQAGLSG